MKKTKVWAGLVVVLIAGSGARAAVRTVPNQYGSIQGAIDAAQNGDIVVVDRGTYGEAIDFKGKNIVVRSTDPNDPATVAATIIAFTKDVPRGTVATGSAVTFSKDEGPGAVLAGFTITGGYGTSMYAPTTQQSFWGAGIYCYQASPTITRNVLTGNNGPGGVQVDGVTRYCYGGGIACMYSRAIVVRNVIQGNSAYYGGGIYVNYGNPRIADNLIHDNSATVGGGVVMHYGGNLTNNTIARNSASTGGGVYLVASPSSGVYRVTSNIISHARSGGGIYLGAPSAGGQIAFNDVWNNAGGSDLAWSKDNNSAGNISVDPLFVSLATADFHLQPESPCINAGDPDYALASGETDAYGAPRVNRGRVDMGTAEFNGDFRPVAQAGPDQSLTVVPAVVTLDAGGSYDPDPNTILSYHWSQVSGRPVALDVNGPFARFAPGGYGAFIFQLVVSDGILDSVPSSVRVLVDNGRLPVAEAGLPVYTAGESVTLNGGSSHDANGSAALHYHWRQVSGPPVQVTDTSVAAPAVSGFVPTDTLQTCLLQLTVDDGQAYGLPDSVEVRVVPTMPGITMSNESGAFDANKPTVIYFGGGDCITGSGSWGSTAWAQKANVLSFSYGPDGARTTGGTYERCGDAIISYLSRQAPDYKMPIQTIGWSTGGQPAIDAALRLNLTYRDARYAVNRITFVDGRCRDYTASIAAYLASSVEGEQCWIDSYDSRYSSSVPWFWPGILNVQVSNNVHTDPPTYYRDSLTNANMNNYNGGLVAGAYWSVLGPGKNLQLAVAPDRAIYEFKGYNAVSPGYEFMQLYDQENYPARLPEPVTLVGPVSTGDPCGVVLTCKPSQNAVGYQLLLGRDPYRVMDFTVVSDTPAPPDKVIRTLPYEETWWTVRARDVYGSTIYADPVPITAFHLSLPVTNLSTGRRYAAIQDAVDNAGPGDEIGLQPGIYHEDIQVNGTTVSIRSTAGADLTVAAATIIDGGGKAAVVTCSDGDLTLTGLEIKNGLDGIYCSGGSLTATNCRIVGHRQAAVKLWSQSHLTAVNCIIAGSQGAGVEMWWEDQGARRTVPYNDAVITNCTIAENQGAGIWGGKPTIVNSIVWNNAGGAVTGDVVVVTYSDVQHGYSGPGNLDADPYFVQAGSWTNGAWTPGDYHLKSNGARWNSQAGGTWVQDHVTSPCIDAGDPASPLGQEPATVPGVISVNVRIDMGVYGGTAQASLAP